MIFKSDKMLHQYIQSVLPSFDVMTSFKLSRFSFYTIDGVTHKHGNFNKMLSTLNTLIGEEYFDTKKSVAKGSYTYLLYTREEGDVVVEEPKQPSKELVEPVIEEVEVASSSEQIPELDKEEIDWPRLEALKNTKSDKAELAEYATKYGVSLKRNKTIDNMLSDFKEALE
jgi:hypothetical protein